MGLFDAIFNKNAPKPSTPLSARWGTLTAYQPVFSSGPKALYESEMVRAAIYTKAKHISKLGINVQGTGESTKKLIERSPNQFQTWSQFLARCSTILDMQNTCFILPMFNEWGNVNGYYASLPSSCEIRQDDKGDPWIVYTFVGGKKGACRLYEAGILTKHQYSSDFFGEDNKALFPTIELDSYQKQGVKEAIKSSSSYKFWAKLSNFSKSEDLVKARKEFNTQNFGEEADARGVLVFPNVWDEVHELTPHNYVMDASTQALILENINSYFGVCLEIIQSKASAEVMDTFFNSEIEPLSIQMSEVLTKMTFAPKQIDDGARVLAVANRLQYMSSSSKISMVKELGDRGIITIDEGRELLNYAPLPNGLGNRTTVRGEYYMIDAQTGDVLSKPIAEAEKED